MNIQVNWESTNITSIVTSYERGTDICTSMGNISVTVGLDSKNYTTWDTIVLWEEGVKKGTFYISEISKDVLNDATTISCQDASKYLTDYFVIDSYELDYVSSSKFWIEKFLNEAGVSYNFNTASSGNSMAQNTAFGMSTAYDIIFPILQQNGWYMYADADGVLQIGEFDLDTTSVSETFTDSEIINIQENQDDNQLRNRAVVWGNTDPLTNDWIHADVSVDTDWQIDTADKRTVVLGDSNIRSTPAAYDTAYRILNAFQYSIIVKTITVIGGFSLSVGETVFVKSKFSQGYGLITQLQSSMSSSGLTTTVVLDRKCPRLFSYFSYDGEIYAGTWGDGIYKKAIDGTTWSNFSSGLGNLYIRDLAVYNSILICIADDGYAYKRRLTEDSAWSQIAHGEFIDELAPATYSEVEVRAIACSISRVTNEIFIGINAREEAVAWILALTPEFEVAEKIPVIVPPGERTDFIIEDLDTSTDKVILTAASQTTGEQTILWQEFGGEVSHKTHKAYQLDETSLTFGPKSGNDFDDYVEESGIGGAFLSDPLAVDDDIYLVSKNDFAIFIDGDANATVYTLPSPAPLLGDDGGIVRESSNKYHFVISDNVSTIRHYSYIISTDTLTLENTLSLSSMDADFVSGIDFAVINNQAYYIYEYDDGATAGWKIQAYVPITQVSSAAYAFGNGSTGDHGGVPKINGGFIGFTNDSVTTFTARMDISGTDWEMFGGYMKYSFLTHVGSYSETSLESGTANSHSSPGLSHKVASARYWGSNVALNASFGVADFGIEETYGSSANHLLSRAWVLSSVGSAVSVHSEDLHVNDIYSNNDGYGGLTLSGVGFQAWGSSTLGVHNMTTRAQNPIAIVKTWPGNYYIEDLLSNTKVAFSPFDSPSFESAFGQIEGCSAQVDDFDDTFYYMYQDSSINYIEGISPALGVAIKTATLPDTGSMANRSTVLVVQGKIATLRGSLVHVYESNISHIPDELDEGLGHRVLSYQGGSFQDLDSIRTEARVEISKYSPTLVYSVPSGVTLIIPTGIGWSYARGSDFLAASYTNLSGSWSGSNLRRDATLDPIGPIVDARIYDVYKSGTSIFAPASGVVDDSSNIRYIGYSDSDRGFASIPATTSGTPFYIYIPSGLSSMIETTNYTFPQAAIFLSTSGSPSSFYQQAADESVFSEQSTGLPNSNITVLKVDDRI